MTITVRKLMAAVAVLGLILGAGRAHFSLGSFVGGLLGIAWIETARVVRRREEESGAAVGMLATIELFGHSAAMAAVILVGSMIALAMMILLSQPLLPSNGPTELAITLLCLYATARVARWLRREFGRGRVVDPPPPTAEPVTRPVPAAEPGIARVANPPAARSGDEGAG